MSQAILQVVQDDNTENQKSKEEYIVNYLKLMIALEEDMQHYKEQKKELRTEIIENGWLTKEDIWSAVKALRMYQKSADLTVNEMFDIIEKKFGQKEEV